MRLSRQRWRSLPSSLRWSLILMFYLTLIGSFVFWQYQRHGGAALYIHNHTDRPIFSYWVNDNWGGNAFAYGGGKTTCCWRIDGDRLKVVWILSRTRAQSEQGIEEERHELDIPNPPRERTDDTLHVHFLPGNQVRLAWNRSATSPLTEELRQRYPRKAHDNP